MLVDRFGFAALSFAGRRRISTITDWDTIETRIIK